MYHRNSSGNYSSRLQTKEAHQSSLHGIAHSKDFRAFKNANLQEIFLNNCRKNGDIVSVHMLEGESIKGVIIGFDSQSIILSDKNSQNLIYKSAISSVIPQEEVRYIFGEELKKEYCSSNSAWHQS